MSEFIRVQSVKPGEGFTVDVRFTNGAQRKIDLRSYLQGPIFESIRNNPLVFRSMCVEGGTIAWPNGADIDPDVLYYGLPPAWTVTTGATSSEKQSQVRTPDGSP